MLRRVFGEVVRLSTSSSTPPLLRSDSLDDAQVRQQEVQRVNKDELFELVKDLPGYGGIKVKDFEYVLGFPSM